ncbi:MAG: hypothetical protein ACI9SY_000680 [Candidatus Paceibacteria bacterium]|jgi:hypothetical protein
MSDDPNPLVCIFATGIQKVQNAKFVMINVEPTGERRLTFYIKRCSFAAMPNEAHSGLLEEATVALLLDLKKQGLELIVARDAAAYDLVQQVL